MEVKAATPSEGRQVLGRRRARARLDPPPSTGHGRPQLARECRLDGDEGVIPKRPAVGVCGQQRLRRCKPVCRRRVAIKKAGKQKRLPGLSRPLLHPLLERDRVRLEVATPTRPTRAHAGCRPLGTHNQVARTSASWRGTRASPDRDGTWLRSSRSPRVRAGAIAVAEVGAAEFFRALRLTGTVFRQAPRS